MLATTSAVAGAIETSEQAAVRNAGGQPGATEVVMDQVDVAAQAELGHQEPEMVLAGDEVRAWSSRGPGRRPRRRRSGVDERGAARPAARDRRRRAHPRPGSACAARRTRSPSRRSLMPRCLTTHSGSRSRPSGRAGRRYWRISSLETRCSGKVRTDAHQGDRDFRSQSGNRGTRSWGHLTGPAKSAFLPASSSIPSNVRRGGPNRGGGPNPAVQGPPPFADGTVGPGHAAVRR